MNDSRCVWALVLGLALLAACGAGPEPTEDLLESPLPLPTQEIRGDQILFTSDRGGRLEYYLMAPDGSAVRRLAPEGGPTSVLGMAWAAQIGRFVLTGRSDGDQEIYLANWELDRFENVSNGPDVTEDDAAVSPDGRWVAMVCAQADPDLCLVEIDGSGRRQLTGPPGWDAGPVWSPDSTQIAFVSNAQGISDLYLVEPAGEEEASKLTVDAGRHTAPDWSPDGTRIAYQGDADRNWDIWTISPDGTELSNLTQAPSADEVPKWSPDGRWIAFRSNRDGDWEIYVMAADGSDPRNVSQSPGGTELVFTWSGDSKKILFVSDAGGNSEIWTARLDGSGRQNLTQNPAQDGAPQWVTRP